MNILLIEPFFTGSHQRWAEAYQTFSQHNIKILSLPGRHWKWRMYAGAVELAKQLMALSNYRPDLILATDMLDLTTFLALTRSKTASIPTALYFHENQITYPWSATDPDVALKRANQYGFINYTSALAADCLFFNSPYHQNSFLSALPDFLKQFPDYKGLENIPLLEQKSAVLPLGIDLIAFDAFQTKRANEPALLLWNHRWEYDKNPESFFKALFRLQEEGIDFQVAVLGTAYKKSPAIFKEAQKRLAKEIVQFGAVQQFAEYAKWLWKADILPVTNKQDFFGQSVVEAIYCNCFPILPTRLAYPMHLPITEHPHHFYQKDEDFYPFLKSIIKNINKIRSQSFQHFVSLYDWRTLVAKYDETFFHRK